MTIIVGFSSSRQGPGPLHVAARIARDTGEKIIAAAVVERPWPPPSLDPAETQYLDHVAKAAADSLATIVSTLPDELDIEIVVSQSNSISNGLLELATERSASVVVVGSSSSGLLGRITLGAVTDRLVHTAHVPVVIAPRGYPLTTSPLTRLTVAYGGRAESNGLIEAAAALGQRWALPLRIASFTVRPVMRATGWLESGDDKVVEAWAGRTADTVKAELDKARESVMIADTEVVIGSGRDWQAAVENIAWSSGDLLLLGSGSAGLQARVFLGTAASRIIRYSPVPVIILPRPPEE